MKFASQLELGKLGVEKCGHARNPKLPYFEESKDKMGSYLSRFRSTRSQINGIGVYGPCI